MLSELLDNFWEKARTASARVEEISGREYLLKENGDLKPIKEPDYPTLELTTLAGLAEYIKTDIDDIHVNDDNKAFVHVGSHTKVSFVSESDMNDFGSRQIYAAAKAFIPEQFAYGAYVEAEKFIVQLQSMFLPTADREKVLRIMGNLTSGAVRTSTDDGVTQSVAVRAGVTLKGEIDVQNPVELKPFRTFHDVDQPVSPFILRVKQDGDEKPKAALFEADGGKWRIDAMKSIVAKLTELLPAGTVILS